MSDAERRHDKEAYRFARKFFGGEDFLFKVNYFGEERGEIDAYGFVGNELYLIEYKTHYTERSRRKAISQLKRAWKVARITGVETHLIFAFEKEKYKEITLREG